MKKSKQTLTVFYQICKLIPPHLVPKLATKHGVDMKSRTNSPWSHVTSMIYMQFARCVSLNDVCDSLKIHSGYLKTIRNAKPLSRSGLAYANQVRDASMAEELFWTMMGYLQNLNPKFGYGHGYKGVPRRFKRTINILDSTTIKLVANCIDWAAHRRQKAAAKMHMNLNPKTFMPRIIIIDKAAPHDASKARVLCAGMKRGEIMVADKAYLDFKHFNELTQKGIHWVCRSKVNMAYEVIEERECKGKILNDQLIRLTGPKSAEHYQGELRLVRALIKVKGKEKEFTYISNHMTWAASSICDLYESRWTIEVFFKQIKQSLNLVDFLGNSENAVRWQIWTAMLTYILLRFIKQQSKWPGTFSRLCTYVRAALWTRQDLYSLLEACHAKRTKPTRKEVYLTGFDEIWQV